MKKSEKKVPPPYTTYKSFSNFIEGLREKGMPGHLSRSVLPGSNSAKATMAASLKSMGLTLNDDSPTEKMNKLVDPQGSYKDALNEILVETYDFLSNPDFDIKNTTTEKVVEQMRAAGAGGSTITKCIAFFLAACVDASIEVSRFVKAPVPPSVKKKPQIKMDKQNNNTEDDGGEHIDEVPEGMERITIPLRNLEDGYILFPAELEKEDAKRAIKMAVFILNNFYEIDD